MRGVSPALLLPEQGICSLDSPKTDGRSISRSSAPCQERGPCAGMSSPCWAPVTAPGGGWLLVEQAAGATSLGRWQPVSILLLTTPFHFRLKRAAGAGPSLHRLVAPGREEVGSRTQCYRPKGVWD